MYSVKAKNIVCLECFNFDSSTKQSIELNNVGDPFQFYDSVTKLSTSR